MKDRSIIISHVIKGLQDDPAFRRNVTHWEVLPAREGVYRNIPGDVSPELCDVLKSRGINRLYSHQHESYNKIREKKNTVIVTPTASGKTLAYNLPLLQSLLEDRNAKAMYIFPTKALSQDQQSELNEILIKGNLPVKVFTYDGDTPASVRMSVRESGQIVITNPDMLHTGILPNHTKWIKFFTNLRFVVIDEIHAYRGVFGSHMANLIRRLKRIASFYGSNPVFIASSATIGNPRELTEKIIGDRVSLIDNNGAPSGERHFIFYNPPIVDRVQGIRRGVVNESKNLALRFLKAGLKTIVFARSRLRTELIASYINGALENFYSDNGRIVVASYRGGYLPGERRSIERGLREGSINGVVSTNALELGIDIGGLDVSILAGFPGSVSSSWQQAGRAGRRNSTSISVLVASSSPIDQYVIKHPEYFFKRSPECGFINPDNPFILVDQLKCAAFELPFSADYANKSLEGSLWPGYTEKLGNILGYLEENGVLRFTGNRWYWADRSYPAEGISLRTATPENVVIVDRTRGRNEVIGEMDLSSAKMLLYEGAIYLHRGDSYIVKRLDVEDKRCYVEESRENYYTDSIVKTDIKVLEEDGREDSLGANVVWGDVLVRNQATKYKKLKFKTHENIGYGEINLPPDEIHTRAVIILFEEDSPMGKFFSGFEAMEGVIIMKRLGNIMKNVAPVFLFCDPGDIGIAERFKDDFFSSPALYIYDRYPGGTGLAEGFKDNLEVIVKGAYELVTECQCKEGCPSCIGPPSYEVDDVIPRGVVFRGNPKELVIDFLKKWIETEM